MFGMLFLRFKEDIRLTNTGRIKKVEIAGSPLEPL